MERAVSSQVQEEGKKREIRCSENAGTLKSSQRLLDRLVPGSYLSSLLCVSERKMSLCEENAKVGQWSPNPRPYLTLHSILVRGKGKSAHRIAFVPSFFNSHAVLIASLAEGRTEEMRNSEQ